MNSGVPPTAAKARTGELTPPGMTRLAAAKDCVEEDVCLGMRNLLEAARNGQAWKSKRAMPAGAARMFNYESVLMAAPLPARVCAAGWAGQYQLPCRRPMHPR